jgi:hypothetical protein
MDEIAPDKTGAACNKYFHYDVLLNALLYRASSGAVQHSLLESGGGFTYSLTVFHLSPVGD